MDKSKLSLIALITILLVSYSIVFVSAQYQTENTSSVTIGSDGTFTASAPDVGVSYNIEGTPGATGTVTADVYNGNPQPGASVPNGIALTHFIALVFNMNSNDFTQAVVTINYTASDVQGIKSDYVIYKYVSSSNSYVALPSTVDTTAKTITVTLTSINDPLLAIGGTSTSSSVQVPTYAWAIIAVTAVVIVLAVVFLVSWKRRSS